jgi:alkyl sulfatase BDS1-like metallo-beta-lactamase superfamily hydrolase
VFELVEAHGETHDQLFIWLPRQRVLMPGDNYYRAFPNLYTIRGTTPRYILMILGLVVMVVVMIS